MAIVPLTSVLGRRRARRGASGLVELRDSIKKTTIRGILMLHSPKDLCRRRCLINGRHFFKNLTSMTKDCLIDKRSEDAKVI